MADKEIKDYTQVTTPALTDVLVCQQSGTTRKQTINQVFDNITGLDAATTLDGTETIFMRVSGTNNKVTVDTLVTFIIEDG